MALETPLRPVRAPAEALAVADFRCACGQFATGLTVVTVRDGDGWRGMTANSFTSVSLHPPLVLVAVDRGSRTHALLERAERFAVSVLAGEQRIWSDRFAGRQAAEAQGRFDDVPHRLTPDGLPVLDGALASFACRLVARHPAGDHSLFVGQVETLEYTPGRVPLLFFGGKYWTLRDAAEW
jgi:flavin reductase